MDRRVREFVDDILEYDRQVSSVHRAATGGKSPLHSAIESARLGVLGSGCAGTKGVGHAPWYDRIASTVDPSLQARYLALTGDDLATADAIAADGQGDCLACVAIGPRMWEVSLAVRVGLRVATKKILCAWGKWVAVRDTDRVISGASKLGECRLRETSERWLSMWDYRAKSAWEKKLEQAKFRVILEPCEIVHGTGPDPIGTAPLLGARNGLRTPVPPAP